MSRAQKKKVKHRCRLKDLGPLYHSPRNETLRYCTVCQAGYFVGDKTPSGATVQP